MTQGGPSPRRHSGEGSLGRPVLAGDDDRTDRPMAEITVYGAPWCPDCRRSKEFLAEQRIDYDWIDIDRDPEAAALVRGMNGGSQIIPTILFPDRSFLAEPSNAELAEKL